MDNWSLLYESIATGAESEGLREALCTLGNGYFATRGAAEESRAGGMHYPGTYLAGGYNRLRTTIAGREIENEDLVNMPNWLYVRFRIASQPESDWIDLNDKGVEVLAYEQRLDLRNGVLEREARIRDDAGRITRIRSRRFVHMDLQHLAGIELAVEPENWSGELVVQSGLDGRVRNAGVERYRDLHSDHLEFLGSDQPNEETVRLRVRTNQSRLEIAQAARTRAFVGNARLDCTRTLQVDGAFIGHELTCTVRQGEATQIEKVVAMFTSRDTAISEVSLDAAASVAAAPSFQQLLDCHEQAWRHLWYRCDMVVKELPHERNHSELILRLHIFHLLQTASFNTIDLDVGVPARGWHGEAYRGHIFWDELFIYPFLNLRVPEITRSLLRYRYRRLGAAQRAAKAEGYRGAMYPWQSGSNGREETQKLHLNPRSGRWLPDHTHLQRHVNAAIAYNIWQYVQITGDCEFLSYYGAEMTLEIARFWASMCTYNADDDRYEIKGVVGPDEYHDGYPDRDEPGLDNNAYTNIMAAWTLHWAVEAFNMLDDERQTELRDSLNLQQEELEQWSRISRRMCIPFHKDGGKQIISQFEGYGELEELDWDRYRATYPNLHRLDRILEAEGIAGGANRYKVSKQADVLMLFYLFSAQELKTIFDRLGYEFDAETIQRNVDYYLRRTDHGSTLSRVVHSWVLARLDRPHAGDLFREALESDIGDIQGGTTREGIHLGAMAGTVDLVQRCFTGLTIHNDVLWLAPRLPQTMQELRLRIRYRGNWIRIVARRDEVELAVAPSAAMPFQIGINGQVHELSAGEERRFAIEAATAAAAQQPRS